MAIFEFRKKEKISSACNCDAEHIKKSVPPKAEGERIKILGSGCAKCNQLEAATKAALEKLRLDLAIEHVRDFAQIAGFGVMTTPALVVDGKVVSYGKVLKADEIAEILQKVDGLQK